MARLRFMFVSAFILYASFIHTNSQSQCQKPKKPAPFFIFGDSYFDAGNNNYLNTSTLDQANFWPYGETFFKYPTGRFSDGRLVPDFIAEYAKLPLIPPYLQPGISKRYTYGVNFASGGAGALVETFQGSVINLETQLRNYKKVESWISMQFGNVEAKRRLSSAVYLFSIGSNDYLSPFFTKNSTFLNSYSHAHYVNMVIGNFSAVVKEVYERGGRKFGFWNLGPLGCFPELRILRPEENGRCLEEATALAKLHNKAMSKLLRQLERQLPGFTYSIFDLNSYIRQRMNNPSNYGFEEGEAACCGTGKFRGVYSCGGKRPVKVFELCDNPNKFLFWDSVHLTQSAYKQIADQMWSGASNNKGPHNFNHLFQCVY